MRGRPTLDPLKEIPKIEKQITEKTTEKKLEDSHKKRARIAQEIKLLKQKKRHHEKKL